MHPNLDTETELVFDSAFESGNLDLVIKPARDVYDLFMRVDTNTKGHH
jgi:cytosolic carboxypeptidase protein 2/3